MYCHQWESPPWPADKKLFKWSDLPHLGNQPCRHKPRNSGAYRAEYATPQIAPHFMVLCNSNHVIMWYLLKVWVLCALDAVVENDRKSQKLR